MNLRGKIILAIVSVGFAGYAFLGGVMGTYFSHAQQPINDAGAQIRIFESVLQHIQNDYVDDPNLEKVRYGALRGLAEGLDPYSSFLTAEQVREYQTKDTSNRVGIGAEFSQVSAYLYVVSVLKDSPAQKAGLKSGDVIEYIGEKATRDISLYDAKNLVLGKAGTNVVLRVLRTGEKPQTITVTRNTFDIPVADVEMKSGNIAVVKVNSLAKGEAADIRKRVGELSNKGVQKIVLDLRGVAGGDINDAVEVANLFVKDGTLAQVIGRDKLVAKTFTAESSKHIYSGELVALIDLGTAGAGEVVASAILDHKRGEVVGEKSFGAGTDQKLFIIKNSGDGFLLTTEKWASSKGVPFLAEKRADSGVKPSVEVKRPETPEPIEVEEMVDQKDDEEIEPQPENLKPSKSIKEPKSTNSKPSQEDIQLNKALEILQGKAQAMKAGS